MTQTLGSNEPATRFPRRRWGAVPLLLATMIAVAGCTFGSPSDAASPSSDPSSLPPGSDDEGLAMPVDEQTTPLIITSLGEPVIPVRGSDDQFHVAYELSVFNDHPYPAVITSLETVSPDGGVVTSLSQSQVRALTIVLPGLSTAGAPATGIPSGATAVLILEDVYADEASIPASVTPRISASFSPTDAGPDPRASQFPTAVIQTGGPVTTSAEDAVVLGAPVAGAGWLMNNGCCDVLNYHRNVILPLNGTLHAAERYGIDFEQLRPGLAPGPAPEADLRLRPGTDGTNVQDFYAYGAPLLAVADGTVVKVVSDIPDTPLGYDGTGDGVTLNNAGGNTVILQLAPDRFAVYFHNAPDATPVRVGDKVTKGETIAHLGNSGNSTAPHLHFQLTRGPQPFSSENLPYVFEQFDLIATATDTELSGEPAPGPRTDELPLYFNIVDFPAAR